MSTGTTATIPSTSTTTTTKGMRGGSRSRRRGRKQRKMRGGYSSAATFQVQNVGSENDQYNNTFIRGGPFGASIQNLAGTQPSVVAGVFPSAASLNLIQSAGSSPGSRRRKRRGGTTNSSSDPSDSDLKNGGKRRSRRAKRGGYWENVISQALVPFSLLFAQNRYGTRKHRK